MSIYFWLIPLCVYPLEWYQKSSLSPGHLSLSCMDLFIYCIGMSFNQKHCCPNSERNLIFQKVDVHQLILYCESSNCMKMIKSLSSPIWISLNTPWFGPLSECHRTFIFIPFFLSIPYREMASTDVLSAHSPTPSLSCTLLTWFFALCLYVHI